MNGIGTSENVQLTLSTAVIVFGLSIAIVDPSFVLRPKIVVVVVVGAVVVVIVEVSIGVVVIVAEGVMSARVIAVARCLILVGTHRSGSLAVAFLGSMSWPSTVITLNMIFCRMSSSTDVAAKLTILSVHRSSRSCRSSVGCDTSWFRRQVVRSKTLG